MKRGHKYRKDIWLQGSYTVEAALLVPILLFAIMKGLLLGIDCYQDVRGSSSNVELLEEVVPTEQIWKWQMVQKGCEMIYEHTISEKSEK